MAKYKRSKQELQEHWDAQVRFIQKSVKDFDAGDESGSLDYYCYDDEVDTVSLSYYNYD